MPAFHPDSPVFPSRANNTSPLDLDFRRRGKLSGDLLRRLNAIGTRDASTFNEFIADLSRGHEHDIDWWVCRPATRNNHVSHLYAQCMQIKLLRELLNEGVQVRVRVDSPEMAAVLKRETSPMLTVAFSGGWKIRVARLVDAIRNIISSGFHCSVAAYAAWLTRDRSEQERGLPLNIVNTFVSRTCIVDGEYLDRYYPGLWNSLSESEREAFRYLPCFYRIRNYLSTFRALRRGRAKFLFYEDHLGLRDYAFAFGHWWRATRLTGTRAIYAEFDIGPLVDADIKTGRFASIVVRALLAYRFHLGASRRNLRIARILDWYEGLDFNHAIAAAINWHSLQIELTGFRSAGSLYYMSSTPAPHEVACQVLPPKIAVVGTGLAREIQSLCPALHVLPAPGLRYRELFALQRAKVKPTRAVLLALPLSCDLACDAIRFMKDAREYTEGVIEHWWVKSHPALPEAQILAALGGNLPVGFEFVRGNYYTWLAKTDLVAGIGSSALMESVAAGIPTLCLAMGNIPTEVPIPGWVSSDVSRVTYGALETAKAIDEALSAAPLRTNNVDLQEAMLGTADMRMMRRLLGLTESA